MRSLVRSLGIAAGIVVLAGVQNASAQIIYPVEFTTSFPFTVGYATVPAGSYTIAQDDDNPLILRLIGARESVLFQVENAQAPQTPAKTEVVFRRYGDGYVLKDIWLAGSDIGAESTTVEGERHAAKQSGTPGEQRVAGRRKSDASKGK